MSNLVTKRCEWNRYCFFVGQFYTEPLVEIGRGRPQLVGRCNSCGGYVCNRCASRRSVEGLPPGHLSGTWQLSCPLDGEPLGRGDEWIVFSEKGAVVSRCVGRPGFSALYEALGGARTPDEQGEFLNLREPLVSALRLLEAGQYSEATEACELARELTPDHPVMWLVRCRALEKMGETAAAWSALRNFIHIGDDKLTESFAELGWLNSESGVSLDSYAKELFALSESRDQELRENLSSLVRDSNSRSQADAETTSPDEVQSRAQTIAPDDFQSLSACLAAMPPTEQIQLTPETPSVHRKVRSLLDEQYGHVIAESIPQGAQSALTVLCHEYDVASQQQSIYRQLEQILQKDPSAMILLEGFSGPRTQLGAAINDYEKRLAVALGMLGKEGSLAAEVLTRLYPASATIQGVDDANLLASQRSQAELVVSSRKSQPDSTSTPIVDFTFFEFILDNLERGTYGPEIRRFHELRKQFYKDGKLATYIRGLRGTIRAVGISLDDYPSTSTLTKAMEMEAEMDFQKVEQERLALVEMLAEQGFAPMTEEKAAAIDRWIKKASLEEEALAPLYPELSKVAEPKPQRKSRWWWPFKSDAVSEPEELADDTPAWFSRLLLLSIALRDQVIPSGYYHYRLNGLLACLGIEIPPQSLLRQYMEYMILASLIDVSSLVAFELPALEPALRARLCRTALDYGACGLHQEFYDLRRLVRLRLPAERARQLQQQKPSFRRWAGDALRLEAYVTVDERSKNLVMSMARRTIRDSRRFDNTLTKACEYYAHALHRSQKLIRNALATDLNTTPVKVLVCGRFHLGEVLRAIPSEPRVSLIVVAPFPKRGEKTEHTKQDAWSYVEEEEAMPPARLTV